MVMFFAIVLLVYSVIIMQTVQAEGSDDSTDDEMRNNDNVENVDSELSANSSNKGSGDNSQYIIGSTIIVIIIALIGILMYVMRSNPESNPFSSNDNKTAAPKSSTKKPTVSSSNDDFDYDAWGSSDSNWSKVNESWVAKTDETTPEYGKYEEQYNKMYNLTPDLLDSLQENYR
jgi:hypothetical protein